MTKHKNYFRITDPKIDKALWWMCSSFLAIFILTLALCLAQIISSRTAQPGYDLFSLLPNLFPFIKVLAVVSLVLFLVFLTIKIYVYGINEENDQLAKQQIEIESPLLGVAKEHQTQIIELFKSVAMPAPNKQNINLAPTAKLLKALKELQLIDHNRDSRHLMAWIENVTNYPAGKTGVFNQALNAVKKNDSEVEKYKEQIQQILAQ